MRIYHNISAMNAHRVFMINHQEMDVNIERLSSGMRINRSRDDAAGLAISERMRAQVRGLNVAARNAQDGISLIQTAEGWLQEVTDLLQRIRELSVQAANGVYTSEDRIYMQLETNQLIDEIDRIASQAQFSDSKEQKLLSGTFGRPSPISPTQSIGAGQALTEDQINALDDIPEEINPLIIHVGANMDQNERITIDNMHADALGLRTGENNPQEIETVPVNITSIEGANQALASVDNALTMVSAQRARLGAFHNRLEHAIKGINIAAENLQSAESKIRDTDMAREMVEFVKNQILSQSTASMLAQANLKPQLILRVLG